MGSEEPRLPPGYRPESSNPDEWALADPKARSSYQGGIRPQAEFR
jgi:hypothetical protein